MFSLGDKDRKTANLAQGYWRLRTITWDYHERKPCLESYPGERVQFISTAITIQHAHWYEIFCYGSSDKSYQRILCMRHKIHKILRIYTPTSRSFPLPIPVLLYPSLSLPYSLKQASLISPSNSESNYFKEALILNPASKWQNIICFDVSPCSSLLPIILGAVLLSFLLPDLSSLKM